MHIPSAIAKSGLFQKRCANTGINPWPW